MKIRTLFLTGILAFSINAFGHEATSVTEKSTEVGTERGTALSTKIKRATEKDIIKSWKSEMKGFDENVKTNKSTITATDVKIKSIDPRGIEVFAEARVATEQEFELVVIFIKNGKPLSAESDLSVYTAAKSILIDFANKLSKEATEEHHEGQNKIVGSLVKDLERAEKEKEKAEEAIKDVKRAIKEAEETIKEKTKFLSENKKALSKLAEKIKAQEQKVKKANDELDLFK